MSASGAIDGDNLWITAVQHTLPTLRTRAITQPLLKKLDQLAEQIPLVLWTTIQALVAPAQVRDLLVLACFDGIHHNNRLGIENLFKKAGFKTQAVASREPGATDNDMMMRIALQFAECARHEDSVYVGVGSDHFMRSPIEAALDRSSMDVVAINFRSNSGRFMRDTEKLQRAHRNRFRVHHNETDPDFRRFWLACTEVDPRHDRWRGTAVEEKVRASAVRSLLARERDLAKPRSPGEKQRLPIAKYELKNWIVSWLENYANYNAMVGDPPVNCAEEMKHIFYADFRSRGILEEFKDRAIGRGNLTYVRLKHSTKYVADSVERMDANFTQYLLDHHVL